MYINEMQRTINGLGHAPGGKPNHTIAYGHWQPYRPGAIAHGRGFGDVPNDFEASVDLQYIPVRQGWYYGHPVDGSGYPDAGLPKQGLGTSTGLMPDGKTRWIRASGMGDAASEEALKQLAKTERLQTILQVVSTLSIATVATLAVMRAIKSRRGGDDTRFFGDDDE